jgi:hypothetical protein
MPTARSPQWERVVASHESVYQLCAPIHRIFTLPFNLILDPAEPSCTLRVTGGADDVAENATTIKSTGRLCTMTDIPAASPRVEVEPHALQDPAAAVNHSNTTRTETEE